MTLFTQVFEADCRNCEHHIKRPLPVKGGTKPKTKIRIKCAECKTTNHVREDDE